jgi:hypothetical protein
VILIVTLNLFQGLVIVGFIDAETILNQVQHMVQHDKYYTSYKEEFELNIIGIYVQVSKLRRMFTIQRDK